MNPTKASEEQITERLITIADRLSDGFAEISERLDAGMSGASILFGMGEMSDDVATVETGLAVLAYIQADDPVESNDTEA